MTFDGSINVPWCALPTEFVELYFRLFTRADEPNPLLTMNGLSVLVRLLSEGARSDPRRTQLASFHFVFGDLLYADTFACCTSIRS